jgi:adenosylcobinamide-phosphate synthase
MDATTLTASAAIIVPLIAGYILDLIFGDPYEMPHPVKLFGKAILIGEKRLNSNKFRFFKGMLMTLILVTAVWLILFLSLYLIEDCQIVWYPVASVLVFYGLANRNLIDEAQKVERKLSQEGLEAGRKQLSYIVGRDTSQLTPNQIRTAVLETMSENLSDGVIAPLFYYSIGGLPLMFAYKMINTLDSMIGYKNERYLQFGKFAARLDDVANFIPARITAFLMVVTSFKWRPFLFIIQYGHKHSSPNAGYPEAALAGILDCRIGGPNTYHGKRVQKPYIGKNNIEITPAHIKKSCRINHISAFVMMIMVAAGMIFLR